jgi:membrane-associated protease RseP (regulator of RpoE activity)
MSVLAAIAILALLIFVHELGHFLAARLQGIHVNRFSIGFGPILWRLQGARTEYAIRALPLGGFVGFPDDDPESEISPDDADLMRNRPVLDRVIVISAGVIANLVFAYLVLALQFQIVGVPDGFNYDPGALVPQVISNDSAAAEAGIKAGDIILSVEGNKLPASDAAIPTLKEAIETHAQQPLDITIKRGGELLNLEITPHLNNEGKGFIGVQLFPNGDPVYRSPQHIGEIWQLAANEFQDIIFRTVQGFGQLILNFGETVNQVAGPVKIVEQGASIADSNANNLFVFAAIVSVNLAIINILPLPALDGGQLAFLVVEGVRGKPLPTSIQDGFMQTGLVLLLGLGIFLIIRDTTQLDVVQQFLD